MNIIGPWRSSDGSIITITGFSNHKMLGRLTLQKETDIDNRDFKAVILKNSKNKLVYYFPVNNNNLSDWSYMLIRGIINNNDKMMKLTLVQYYISENFKSSAEINNLEFRMVNTPE